MIKVIDNFLPDFLFNRVCVKVTSPHFPWNVVSNGYHNDDHKAFVHNIDEFPQGEFSELSIVVASYICDYFNMDIEQLRILRYGLLHREHKHIIHRPHIDSKEKHFVGLLYLTDSDGDTILYKERFENESLPFAEVNKLSIDRQVSPKANRFVFFDGEIYHSSSTPVEHQLRYAVNFNFAKKDI